jgi:hypothetical protein
MGKMFVADVRDTPPYARGFLQGGARMIASSKMKKGCLA